MRLDGTLNGVRIRRQRILFPSGVQPEVNRPDAAFLFPTTWIRDCGRWSSRLTLAKVLQQVVGEAVGDHRSLVLAVAAGVVEGFFDGDIRELRDAFEGVGGGLVDALFGEAVCELAVVAASGISP